MPTSVFLRLTEAVFSSAKVLVRRLVAPFTPATAAMPPVAPRRADEERGLRACWVARSDDVGEEANAADITVKREEWRWAHSTRGRTRLKPGVCVSECLLGS